MPLITKHDALLLDLDGTVWAGGTAIPHAVEAINAAGVPAMYITNNASRSAESVAEMLRAIGLHTQPEEVLTSAHAAVRLAEQHLEPGDNVFVLGAQSFRDLVTAAGYNVVDSADDAPKVVLHGLNPDTGWRDLSEAALAIQRGAAYLASNLDTSLPSERGFLVGNGSMVAAITSATGVAPQSAGKPEPAMFLQAAQTAGSKRPLAVGDRLDTDIAGAVGAGIPALHVATGVSGPLALLEAPKSMRPTYVAEDMRALHADPEELKPGRQGGFGARIDGKDIILSHGNEGATSMQALRTVLEVAWLMPEPPELVRPNSDAAEAATDGWW
ncbi:HAD-IIA family hydrolase [Corynebacterium sp. CNCTC7651]|uniref:HAD-IIA family hydrolase n=1 Tax=Corynebacterium sp. CNCTC7651 TaxID=2815361 RepID=UPI001F1ED540|nr:HAD-IIA family hydrolase [Corynebacterium sp. CNCTC7651]UIZ93095.1 HAD-IIA family hydrolase [Corynebacterium sp. CNCTC7651]